MTFVRLVVKVAHVEYKLLPIPLFEGKYSITTDGRIYSHERLASDGRFIHGGWLKVHKDKDGYNRVCLSLGSRKNQKLFRVCRLVASTYLIPDITKPVVNHLNGIKDDDRVENLEWCTVQDNTQHAWNMGLCKPYDRKQVYKREGIIAANKRRKKSGI
jgi:hypothetical protein